MIIEEIDDAGALELRLDSTLYSEAVVFKTFYWYGSKFDITVVKAGRDELLVRLTAKNAKLTAEDVLELKSRIKRDLIDFKTRDIVARETQVVRDLLVAKAFAHSDQYDEPPIGTIADLGGLDPAANYGPR